MNDLKQISVLGMGLLGASVSLAILRSMPAAKVTGYSHRAETRKKARKMDLVHEVYDDVQTAVVDADLVILATPICTFEAYFEELAGYVKDGCIITDVGSTKVLAHRWAEKSFSKGVFYVGSHPIAGSEKRGLEFARDDLLFGANCIVTRTRKTSATAVNGVKNFWKSVGCRILEMTPTEHDKIFGRVSHVPHLMAAALVNASDPKQMIFAGKGFIDTSRVASGPANVWADIFMTNPINCVQGIDRVINELRRLQDAVKSGSHKRVENLLEKARQKRADLINYKVNNKELL